MPGSTLYYNGYNQVTLSQAQQTYAILGTQQSGDTDNTKMDGDAYPLISDMISYFSKVDFVAWNSTTSAAFAASLPPIVSDSSGLDNSQTNMRKMIVKTVREHYVIANNSNFPVYIKLYDFVWKGKPTQLGGGDNQLGPLWNAGMNALNDATSNLNVYKNIGISPMDSRRLTQFYSLHKVTNVNLAAGESHRHGVINHLFKKVHGEELANMATSPSIPYKGASVCLLVVYGAPVHGDTDHSEEHLTTTASATIDWVWTRTVRIKPFTVPTVLEGRYDSGNNKLISVTAPGGQNEESGLPELVGTYGA